MLLAVDSSTAAVLKHNNIPLLTDRTDSVTNTGRSALNGVSVNYGERKS